MGFVIRSTVYKGLLKGWWRKVMDVANSNERSYYHVSSTSQYVQFAVQKLLYNVVDMIIIIATDCNIFKSFANTQISFSLLLFSNKSRNICFRISGFCFNSVAKDQRQSNATLQPRRAICINTIWLNTKDHVDFQVLMLMNWHRCNMEVVDFFVKTLAWEILGKMKWFQANQWKTRQKRGRGCFTAAPVKVSQTFLTSPQLVEKITKNTFSARKSTSAQKRLSDYQITQKCDYL